MELKLNLIDFESTALHRNFPVPIIAGNLSHHRVQTGSEEHPASYPVGTRGFFPGGEAAGA